MLINFKLILNKRKNHRRLFAFERIKSVDNPEFPLNKMSIYSTLKMFTYAVFKAPGTVTFGQLTSILLYCKNTVGVLV